MKKIVVNKDACIGCGACVSIDDEHFTFNDEGLSEVISNENIESNGVVTAIESCPTNAISIQEEKDDNTKECTCKECKNEETCECNDDCNCEDGCNCKGDCHCTSDDKCCDECHCNEVESE